MTKFENLKDKENKCIAKAIETNDNKLKTFFYNAAEGFRIKIAKLTVKEAKAEV